jgi:hypothetical protein
MFDAEHINLYLKQKSYFLSADLFVITAMTLAPMGVGATANNSKDKAKILAALS